VSRGVNSVCLSISVFTFTAGNASSTTGPAPLNHLHCRIAEHRLGTCLNAPTRADRVGWQQPACVTNPTLSSSKPTFRRNLLLPLQDRSAHTFTQNCYAHPPHCRVFNCWGFRCVLGKYPVRISTGTQTFRLRGQGVSISSFRHAYSKLWHGISLPRPFQLTLKVHWSLYVPPV